MSREHPTLSEARAIALADVLAERLAYESGDWAAWKVIVDRMQEWPVGYYGPGWVKADKKGTTDGK